ncbi:MAG: DUF5979 domain-containing protein [Lacrimispora sp.]
MTFEAAGSYSYTGKGVADGTIKSGDKISLADGESITITGLPDGTKYQVTEADYSSERYTTTSTGNTGIIRTLETASAAFVNNRVAQRSSGGGSGGGSNGRSPVVSTNLVAVPDGQTPAGNISSPTPEEVVTIDGDVPKAGLPKTGDNGATGMMVYILFGISALLTMFGSASLFRKNKISDK